MPFYVEKWVASIGLNPADYGTHSFRRTKASLIYRRTKNLRAVQLLLGHTKLESPERYLGIEVDDALEMAEQTQKFNYLRTLYGSCLAVIHTKKTTAWCDSINFNERES